ncbi:MAG: VOC family protein [Alphaproteobacteria bacterium]|nr:VOC family protein [Alphaproteobacteria bacterium]
MKQYLSTPLTPELICSDIKKSLSFYTDILGFKIQYQREEEGFAMLERQGSRLMLDQLHGIDGKGRSWVSGPLERPYGRGINLQMETRDVDGLYAKVQASGARIFLQMEEKWYRKDHVLLGNRQFIVQDPDGYLLRFFQDLGERKDNPKSET